MKPVRIGIAVLVAFAVLAHGAVEPWSQAILETGAGILLVMWAVGTAMQREIELRWNTLLMPVAGLVVLAVLQLVTGMSAYRYATRAEVLRLAADLILLFVAVQAFRTPKEWKALAWVLIGLAFAVSVFGIVQYFTFNGRLYWVRELRHGGTPFGPFVNRDDFAGFLELILPLGLALLVLDGERRERRLLVALFVVFPAAALVLCASRAGIVSFVFQLVFLGILVWLYGRRSQRWLLVGMAVVMAAVAGWLGVGYTIYRFEQPGSNELTLAGRLAMARDTWRIFLHHPLTGTGLGTFETVYPRYEASYTGYTLTHAHNDYVELLAEGGVVGGGLGLAYLVILFRRGIRNLQRAMTPVSRSLYAGALVACAGLLGHELVDFNLHIPSNLVIFLLISSLATTVIPEPIPNPRHRPRPGHLGP
ncbi:MAG TPA: O-antigen ligase family protein [Candidatus Acidoferrales bacterium]|nr:O-antigen ligase family protein [Candidatus Acidoferrales bacterium]